MNQRLIDDPQLLGKPGGYIAVMLPKLDEKKSIGQACLDFDNETPLANESGNSKRRQEGKQVRSAGSNKRQRGQGPKLCWDFQKGRCTRGSNCRFSHDVDDGGRGRRDDRDRDRGRDRSRSRDRDRSRRDRSRSRDRDRGRRRRDDYSDESRSRSRGRRRR